MTFILELLFCVILIVCFVISVAFLAPKTFRSVYSYFSGILQKIVNIICAIVSEFFIIIGVLILYPFRLSDPEKALIDQSVTPVLFVHGFLHNNTAWTYHRYRCRKSGLKNLYTVSLGYPWHSIESYSKVVKEKIQKIREETNRHDIILVGHSMGGVVCAHYLLNHAKHEKIEVKGIMTLGSPLQGTLLGNFGIFPCAREMYSGSAFIKKQSKDLKKVKTPHLFLGSKTDPIILSVNSSINGEVNRKNYQVFDCMGHLAFLWSGQVALKIIDFIKIHRET